MNFDWDKLNRYNMFLGNDRIYCSTDLPYPKRSKRIKNKRRNKKRK